jgi:hypothetical protein
LAIDLPEVSTNVQEPMVRKDRTYGGIGIVPPTQNET